LGPLSDSQFVGRFERRATAAADHGGTIAAGQGIVHFLGAFRAIEGHRAGFRLRGILRACRHVEENCNTGVGVGVGVGLDHSSVLQLSISHPLRTNSRIAGAVAVCHQQPCRGPSKTEFAFPGMPLIVLLLDQTSEAVGGCCSPRAPKPCYSAQELSNCPSIHSDLICTP